MERTFTFPLFDVMVKLHDSLLLLVCFDGPTAYSTDFADGIDPSDLPLLHQDAVVHLIGGGGPADPAALADRPASGPVQTQAGVGGSQHTGSVLIRSRD
ncbi:hypothetical protein JZ751_002607 [Albula glossodonta]|uniref:Uncharacterized protein n=1 Tax=Albula glossodonta TaxID=121402 RepID=A0A8T2NA99_9TELE|nr:hypothetical protein JZ751_002607 [Albula glossodonta]